MKKTLKLMLAFVLVALCSTSAWAQADPVFGDDAYRYTDEELGFTFKFTDINSVKLEAKATITAMTPAKRAEANGETYTEIVIPTSFQYVDGANTYDVTVTTWESPVFQNCEYATEVTIPACIEAIPVFAFNGCTRVATIEFEEGSQVETIGQWAFATTAIKNFNFSNCSVLAELPDEVFVLPGQNNTYITEITVPTSADFKHVNGAFQNLTKLATIKNLGDCYIQEIVAEAFKGCTKLETLSLPGINMRYIDGNALKGSSVKYLTVNVGEDEGVIHRLLYLGGGTVAKNEEGVYEFLPYEFDYENNKITRWDWAKNEDGTFKKTVVGQIEIPVVDDDGNPVMVPVFDENGDPVMIPVWLKDENGEYVLDENTGEKIPVYVQATDAGGALLWDGYEMDPEATPAAPKEYGFTDAEASAEGFDQAFDLQLDPTHHEPYYGVGEEGAYITEDEALTNHTVTQLAAAKKLYYKRLPKYEQENEKDEEGNDKLVVKTDANGVPVFVNADTEAGDYKYGTDPRKVEAIAEPDATFNVRATTEAKDETWSFTSFDGTAPAVKYEGEVKVIGSNDYSTTVEVTDNEVPGFVGNQYVIYTTAATYDEDETYELYSTAVPTATGMFVELTPGASDGVYNFTSFADATTPTELATGTVKVLGQDATTTTVVVTNNSVDGFEGNVYVVNATTIPANGRLELYSAATGLFVTELDQVQEGAVAEDLFIYNGTNPLADETKRVVKASGLVTLAQAQDYVPAYWTYQSTPQTHNKQAEVQKEEESTGFQDVFDFYKESVTGPATNLYGFSNSIDDKDKTPLETLTLEGVLEGKICSYAFMNNNKLVKATTTLDLTDMTFASTGQIQTNAFQNCSQIKTVKVDNIQDTESVNEDMAALVGYTIDNLAFNECKNLATVLLGDVLTANAIGEEAFYNQLKDVTIGSVNAEGKAFASRAFVWKKGPKATLNVAYDPAASDEDNKAKFISQKSTSAIYPTIPTAAFDFSAIRGVNYTDKANYPTVKIGAIKSKGGAFGDGAFKPAEQFNTFEFMGDIVTNGIDATIIGDMGPVAEAPLRLDPDQIGNDYGIDDIEYEVKPFAGLTVLTFWGAIGKDGGIATGAFDNLNGLKELNFNGKLGEEAVASGAFAFPIMTQAQADHLVNQTTGATGYKLNYNYTGTIDYAVNPFAKNAFNLTSVCASPRYIILTVVNEDLKARFEGNKGLTTDGKYDVYLVRFNEIPEVAAKVEYTFRVYKNYKNDNAELNNVNTAWGRYDFGSFALEKGPVDPEKPWLYTSQNMIIERYQAGLTGYDKEAGAMSTAKEDVKVTLYGVYTDEDDTQKQSTVYMVPLKVIGGKYYISATNNKLIVAKVEKSSELAATDYDIKYTITAPGETLTANSVWSELPEYLRDDHTDGTRNRQQFSKASATDIVTNQMLWDYAGTAIKVWDTANGKPNESRDFANKALFIMKNPANYKGSPVDRMLIRKVENGAYIGRDWTFAIMKSYDYDPSASSSAAPIVWLDEDEATAIFGVNDDAIAEIGSQESGLVNIQGVAVDASYVGLVIDKATGKKFYQNINK